MARIPPRQVSTKDGATVVIRVAEPTDAPALIDLCRHLSATSEFNVTQPDEVEATEAKEREWTQNHLDHPGGLALVAATPEGQLIGILNFLPHKRRRVEHHAHFGISLHADWRGRGLGRHMLQTLIDWARSHELIERIDLGVFAGNAHARALYTSLGFVEVGRREREFKLGPGRYMDDVQMSLWVK